MTAKRKQKHSDLEIFGFFSDIFLVNIYRICKTLISKERIKIDAVLVFDFIFFGLTEWVLYLLGGFKFFGMGDFRFFWVIGLFIIFIVFICGYIGILRRRHIVNKSQNIDVKIANEERREFKKTAESKNDDFKDDLKLPHFSREELEKILNDNPAIKVSEK